MRSQIEQRIRPRTPMNRSNFLPVLLVLVLGVSVLGCSKTRSVVVRDNVEQVVGYLASDELMGRGTFTPEIDKASEFLANEFESIGLEEFDGLDSYEQRFNIFSLTPSSISVTINGKQIDRSDLFVSSTHKTLALSMPDFEVVVVGPGGDLRRAYGAARNADGNTLLIVHPDHESTFARYQQFTSGPSRVVEIGDGPNVVGILSTLAAQPAPTITQADVSATYDVEELDLGNVVGKISGHRSDEVVVFSAHYDHIGVRTVAEGDSIANGANDDASGVAAVVELARFFSEEGKPERTLLFVAFTAEEMGGYGSRYFSKQLDPDQIVAMFNIEMIGKPAVSGPNTAWITGFDRSDFGEILQRAVEGTEYEFYADPYPDQNLFYRSDNATLARLGVPAHSISTTPIDVDPDYHQVSDELETLDLDHLTNTIQAIAAGAATIVSGKETPTRVDPEKM